ncbi:hypothetical protein GCM10023189_20040 [Nibrella saemangeumensis]|uniref:O-antigen ligase n=1 Tax=Nibrella saemangeumensis TaxID=1084526 RepID=A0ABP8MQ64_9BACT
MFGWGADNFVYVYDKYQVGAHSVAPLLYDRSHNVFLDWFVHGGILSGCCYIFLWGTLLWYIWKTTLSQHQKAILTAWWIGSIIYLFLNIDNLPNWILFIFIALYVLNNLPSTHVYRIADKRLLNLLGAACVISGFCLFTQSVNDTFQAYLLTRKFAATTNPETKLDIIKTLIEKNASANYTMVSPIYDYAFTIRNSDMALNLKNDYNRYAFYFIENEIRKRPASVYLLTKLAGLNTGSKNYAGAIRNFQSIIAINPANPGPYVQLGKLYFYFKRYREAYAYFDRAERKVPFAETTLMKIRVRSLLDSAYNFEPDLLQLSGDDRIKNVFLIGTIFREANRLPDYVRWIWKGGYYAKNGASATVLYEFATSAYAIGDMSTLRQVLTMYAYSYGCSPQFASDVLVLATNGVDPSPKLLEYQRYCK